MNISDFSGIIIGLGTFLIIGIFHPIVIKSEYHFGVGCWWVFALCGLAGCITSIFVNTLILSILLGVFGFSCFWSIIELFHQRRRVERGWFPRNPKRAQ